MAKVKSFLENNDDNGMMDISGEKPAEVTTSDLDAKTKLLKELDDKIRKANETIVQLQRTQELPPAHSPKEVPTAAVTWTPASVLSVTGKNPDFHYVWVRNNPESINKAILEHHEVDQDINCCANMISKKDPSSTYSNVKIRGDLILMRIPLASKAAMDAYNKSKIQSSANVARQLASKHQDSGNKGNLSGEISREVVKEKI